MLTVFHNALNQPPSLSNESWCFGVMGRERLKNYNIIIIIIIIIVENK